MSSVDLSAFNLQLETYVAVSSQECAKALNKKALDLCYTATKEIPKLTPAAVRSELRQNPRLVAALTSLHLDGKKLKAPEFGKEMAAFIEHRTGSVNYLRSGFAPVIENLGGKFKGGASQRGLDGYAKKASGGSLEATIVHITEQPSSTKQESAEAVVDGALERAADFQVKDMEPYITRKLSEVFD